MKKNLVMLAFLCGICIITNGQETIGFFNDDWVQKTINTPAYQDVAIPSASTNVNVIVDFKDTITKVSKYVYGTNVNVYSGQMVTEPDWIQYINDLNPHVMRFPGGSLSDKYFWNSTPGNFPSDLPTTGMDGNPASWWAGRNDQSFSMSLDNYYQMMAMTHATGMITVNYGYARYGTGPIPVQNAAHYAADWVRYDNGRTKYWEIGNECYGNWEEGYTINTTLNQDGQPQTISGGLYGSHFKVFVDSMKAAAAEIGADIKIGAVTYEQPTSYDPVQTNWNIGIMNHIKNKADFLVIHSYFTPYDANSIASVILNAPSTIEDIMEVPQHALHLAGGDSLPVCLNEWNTFAVDAMQNVSHISGMFADLILGEAIKNKLGMTSRWDIANGWDNGNDHGMFARADEPGSPLHNPRPSFYHMYFFQKVFGDCMVRSTSDVSSMVTYASSFSSGQSGIVVVNKDIAEKAVQFEMNDFVTGDRYYYYLLVGGTDNGEFSRKVYVNGQTTEFAGGGPDNYAEIEAYSSIIEDGLIKITIPARSACYIIIDRKADPAFSSAWVDTTGTSLIQLQITRPVTAPISGDGFEITINNVVANIINVQPNSADSSILLISITETITKDDTIIISYSGDGWMDEYGLKLLHFNNEVVDNLLPKAPPRIVSLQTDSAGMLIYMKLNKQMVEDTATIVFDVKINKEELINVPVSSVYLDSDAKTCIISLGAPVYNEYTIQLSYSGTGFHSIDSGFLHTFDTLLVENLAPGMPPEVDSAIVTEYGYAIGIYFSKELLEESIDLGNFDISVNGNPYSISSLDVINNIITLYPGNPVNYGDTVLVNFSGGAIMSEDRGILTIITDYPVANNLPVPPPMVTIPDTIQAELFVAMNDIQIETCTDAGGGQNLGYINPGSWMEYDVYVPEDGMYTLQVRVAASTQVSRLAVQIHGAEIVLLDSVYIPVTRGWQAWTTIYDTMQLHEGRQRFRLYALTSGFNLNWFRFEAGIHITSPEALSAKTSVDGVSIEVTFDKSIYTFMDIADFVVTAGTSDAVISAANIKTGDPKTLVVILANPLSISDSIFFSYSGQLLRAYDNTLVPVINDFPVNNIVTANRDYQVEESGLQVYPNPVINELVIYNNTDGNFDRLEIFNLQGQLMLSKSLWINKGQTVQLDLNLENGAYCLVFKGDQIQRHNKIVVIK